MRRIRIRQGAIDVALWDTGVSVERTVCQLLLDRRLGSTGSLVCFNFRLISGLAGS